MVRASNSLITQPYFPLLFIYIRDLLKEFWSVMFVNECPPKVELGLVRVQDRAHRSEPLLFVKG